jgi:hypothetical protein
MRCSFCGKPQHLARYLIDGGNNKYICSECIALCNEIIAHEESLGTTRPLMANHPTYVSDEVARPRGERSRDRSRGTREAGEPDYAPLIQQAIDMVGAQVGCSDTEAIPVMVTYAREHGGSLVEIAQAVVDRTIHFGE